MPNAQSNSTIRPSEYPFLYTKPCKFWWLQFMDNNTDPLILIQHKYNLMQAYMYNMHMHHCNCTQDNVIDIYDTPKHSMPYQDLLCILPTLTPATPSLFTHIHLSVGEEMKSESHTMVTSQLQPTPINQATWGYMYKSTSPIKLLLDNGIPITTEKRTYIRCQLHQFRTQN